MLSHWDEVCTGGIRWQVVPEVRQLLLGPEGLPLAVWLRTGQARVIKDGPHRAVYEVALPGIRFYLKHYRLADARSWLRQLVRPTKARMECDRAQAVAARQVATVTPLALGERCGGLGPQESFLITSSLEGTEPLSAFLEQTLPRFDGPRHARVRHRLAVALGDLLAQLHDAGVTHNDLHAGNVLIRLDANDRPLLYLIDLHAVDLGQPLDGKASCANLVMLNRWFILRANRPDRLRFWRAYVKARAKPEGVLALSDPRAWRELARRLEQLTWQSNLSFWQHRDRRCLTANRYYRRVTSACVVGFVVQDLDRAALAELLADPDTPFHKEGITYLKDSRSSTVVAFDLNVTGGVRRVLYKRFRVTDRTDPWAALFRRPPALRSWIFGHGLRERCLPTARPLAVLHRHRNGLLYEGYLLTEYLPGTQDLHGYLSSLAYLDAAEQRRCLRLRIDEIARLVRELHRRGLADRDLKAGNLLVSANRVSLIDLVGVTRHRKVPRARRVQNLARLNASFHDCASLTRSDRLRFLRVYLQWGLLGRGSWKRWWRAIEQATRAKVARNARLGRPLA